MFDPRRFRRHARKMQLESENRNLARKIKDADADRADMAKRHAETVRRLHEEVNRKTIGARIKRFLFGMKKTG